MTWDSLQAGEISGSGTWTCDQGYTCIGIVLNWLPVNGGNSGSAAQRIIGASGNWGPIKVTGLTSQDVYAVTAVMTEKNSSGSTKTVNSPVVNVTCQ
jgi:hypothetical protein